LTTKIEIELAGSSWQ